MEENWRLGDGEENSIATAGQPASGGVACSLKTKAENKKMEFQTFGGIRLKNFAFKFDLKHFAEIVKAKTLPFFVFPPKADQPRAEKKYFPVSKITKPTRTGAYPLFFSSNLHKGLQIIFPVGAGLKPAPALLDLKYRRAASTS